ncbi:Smr/MutS family protein [Amnimonas aquatica]|uniref:DNA mismatch repair protein MutS n=1 Tax=Amnimonas aquatica TaxID=2094561 RepID=A0A2P6ASU6_9GAMM|nr:Smr/MutS family protein [Amnimonas aquatica]PQA43365.1 DNA mismatch repair protein MutS [Amnimonas aquatica]
MKDPLLTSLRRQLKAEAPVVPAAKPATASVPARPEPELSDEALFAQATKGAKRMETAAPPPRAQKPRKPDAMTLLRRAQAEGEDERTQVPLSDTVALQTGIAPEAVLAFKRNGVQDKQFERLKAGQLVWKAAVDLHGCTLEQAREAVLQLLDEAAREGVQVAKVVHGKGQVNGQALLKTAVNGWLRQLPPVLAFASAPPRDGGTGAVLVLLRRQRETGTPDDHPDKRDARSPG